MTTREINSKIDRGLKRIEVAGKWLTPQQALWVVAVAESRGIANDRRAVEKLVKASF